MFQLTLYKLLGEVAELFNHLRKYFFCRQRDFEKSLNYIIVATFLNSETWKEKFIILISKLTAWVQMSSTCVHPCQEQKCFSANLTKTDPL